MERVVGNGWQKCKGVLLLAVLSLWACHTWIFEPVRGRLEGKWRTVPVDPAKGYEIWEFSGSTLSIYLVDTATGIPQLKWTTDYKVAFKFNKHILLAEVPVDFSWATAPVVSKWYIVNVDKKNLYLASYHKPQVANYQKEFIRYSQ